VHSLDPPTLATTAPTWPAGRGAAFARAAGATGVLSNLLLIVFFALAAAGAGPENLAGPANDLVGSLSCALMVPVAVSLAPLLPRRRAVRVTQVAGIAAMVASAVGGPLLVLGVVPFDIETAVGIGAWMLLAGWIGLVSRWTGRAGTLPPRPGRLGRLVGATTLAAAAGVAAGLVLLPRASVAQLVVLVVAGAPGIVAWLAMPVWFLLLAGPLAALPADRPVPALPLPRKELS
jgi:hypothetical protein